MCDLVRSDVYTWMLAWIDEVSSRISREKSFILVERRRELKNYGNFNLTVARYDHPSETPILIDFAIPFNSNN